MTQQVVSSNPPYIQIIVTLEGETEPIYVGEALIDTGYDGSLSVPTSVIGDRPSIGEWGIELADGSRFDVPYFYGTVEIIGLTSVGVVLASWEAKP